jgi:drug/metabolite transporter (DMT)-like permease
VPTKQNVLPITSVLTGSLVWGLMWYPYRMLQDAGVSGTSATLVTYLLAMLCGAFMLPVVWRELYLHKGNKAGWWIMGLMLSAGWSNLGYVVAILHGEVMRVVLLFYLAPLWTILFAYWLLGERLNHYGYLIIALSLGGAFIMLWDPQVGLPLLNNHAEWIGLSAGMAFALANVMSRRATHLTVESKSYSVLFGTALLTVPFVWWQGGAQALLFAANAQIWLLLGLLGVVLFSASFVVQYALANLPANRAIVLFLFELVVAAVSSYLLADEAMETRDWIGALLIVSASLLSSRLHIAPVR